MQSTLAEEFLNDLDDLSEEEPAPRFTDEIKPPVPLDYDKLNTILESPEVASFSSLNELISSLDETLSQAFFSLKYAYKEYFPALEDLIQDPVIYARTVILFLDSSEITQETLSGDLPNKIILAVLMALKISPIRYPSSESDSKIRSIIQKIQELDSYLKKLLIRLEESLHDVAPNLTELVGVRVGGKLISLAGSLKSLSQMPSCNIQTLGYKHDSNLGK